MKSFPVTVKNALRHILDEMAADTRPFVKSPGSDFSRVRKLSFQDTFSFIISMEGGSLNSELLTYFLYNPLDTPSASAFVQQRSKILPEAFHYLFDRFNSLFTPALPFRGFRLLAVDGSDIPFACNPLDTLNHLNNSSKNGYNSMHLSVLYDLHDRTYADALIQNGASKNEFSAFCSMVDRYPDSLAPHTIFIADRGFSSYNVFAHVIEKGAFFLIRSKDISSNGILSRLPLPTAGSFDVSLSLTLVRRQTKAFRALPASRLIQKNIAFDFLEYGSPLTYPITLRILRFPLPDGSYESLITNLPQDTFSQDDISALYHLRWGVETSFRELKYSVGLVNFHCKKPEFVLQEIWARLILYNFCEFITAHAASLRAGDTDAGGPRLHTYRLNHTMAIHICRCFLRAPAHGPQINVEQLLLLYLLPVRDGRQFPRNMRFRHAVGFLYRVK